MPTLVEGVTTVAALCHHPLRDVRVHMIGIGGCGMSGAAALLQRIGANVSGSDLLPFDAMGELVAGGARISLGHREGNVHPGVDLVVTSAAVPDDNPELIAAHASGIRVIKYAQLVGELMRGLDGVAVAGTHGKSTTTAMCAYAFREAGLSPSFLVGARCDQMGGHSGVGESRHLIVESCEFDRSFLQFGPLRAAILNIEADHLDCYVDLEEIVEAFSQFAARVRPGGLLVCNAEDLCAVRAASACDARVETFGLTGDPDWTAQMTGLDCGRHSFNALYRGHKMLSTTLALPGRYNVSNALAAIALAHDAGADLAAVGEALRTFRGVNRRLTYRGEGNGVLIVDDYAHHPTEIRVTIGAARDRYRPQRTWVVFQPHQQSRTQHFMADFAGSFSEADRVVVPDVYNAREVQEPCGQRASEELVSRIVGRGVRAQYLPTLEEVTDHVSRHVEAGDMVLTMGAGDVWKVADELVERFCRRDGVRHAPAGVDVVPTGRKGSLSVSAA